MASRRPERAVGPAYESRRHLPEEDMKDEIVEVGDAQREKDVPGNQLLDDDGGVPRRRRAGNRDQRDAQPDDEEGEREVRQEEGNGGGDEIGHDGRRLAPGERIDNLPPLRAQLPGGLAEFVA